MCPFFLPSSPHSATQEDMVCLSCTATGERVCLAAEGFGNRHCFLENIADKNIPPDLSQCVFVIEQALSVRALQELVTAAGSETVSIPIQASPRPIHTHSHTHTYKRTSRTCQLPGFTAHLRGRSVGHGTVDQQRGVVQFLAPLVTYLLFYYFCPSFCVLSSCLNLVSLHHPFRYYCTTSPTWHIHTQAHVRKFWFLSLRQAHRSRKVNLHSKYTRTNNKQTHHHFGS